MRNRLYLKTLLVWIVFSCWVQGLNAQQQIEVDSSNFIEWHYQEPLTWNDYRFRKLNRKRYAGHMAITTVKISARGYIRSGIPDFKVKVFFVKPDSWTSDTVSVNLLRHEQVHFDIGEIYAQKIREKIVEMREGGITSPKRYRLAIQNLITLFKTYSGQYDRHTSYGTIIEKQEEWQEKIAKRIDEISSN